MQAGNLKESQRIDGISSQLKRSTPTMAVSSKLNGKWQVHFTNGVDRVVDFRPDGTVISIENGIRRPGKIVQANNETLLQLDARKIERLGVSGNRLYIEHFNPASRYPKEFPSEIGIGTPVQ